MFLPLIFAFALIQFGHTQDFDSSNPSTAFKGGEKHQ